MTNTHPDIDYANKAVLAPMVRIGTLPTRLLALDYGADLVWTEELVDKRVIGSVRTYNPATGTIDYRKGKAKALTFSTCDAEKGKVILQLGTADADLALEAALTVKQDVAGIDLNCGCPKKFSVQGGMGAALLSNPDNLKKILTKLVDHSGVPVSCKIRLLETQEETINLVRMIVGTGVKALTVHCRTKDQRSSEKAKWERLAEIVDFVKSISDIPVIVNGDVYQYADIEKAKEITHADSVMIARGAQLNPSAFRKEGLLSFDEYIKAYLTKCIDVDNLFQNTKYCVLCMNTEDSNHTRSNLYASAQRSKSLPQLYEIFGLTEYYQNTLSKQKARLEAYNKTKESEETNPLTKREREDEEKEAEEPVEKKLKADE